MLTRRENLLETIRGGNPDRFVKQFEPFALQWATPQDVRFPAPEYGKGIARNCWGVYFSWPEGTPGPVSSLDSEHRLIKDIYHWQDYLKMPETEFPESEWKWIMERADKVDRNEYFVTAAIWPGLFENCLHMMGMEEFVINMYEEPEIIHAILDLMTEYEVRMARQICNHIHPDAVFRLDDWGGQSSTFLSVEMFHEFIFERTKKIYDTYRENGVEIIVHHSDSYAETLVPEMLNMGIDIWQGAFNTNDLPRLVREYKGRLTVMGGINSGIVDSPDWTREKVAAEVEKIIRWTDSRYFIPNLTFGGDESTYRGVYEAADAEIEKMGKEYFAEIK
ncbi:uroporphyrinogen decarboxylase family protein [Parasporobacterium paucivorans]|uniref:Uroporphyrinogen decarboxylase (URO-D) n=1 Tax=Parasporobacterium paucivorans DSM 15970 TaxID=1122934 RepID=A0A1M6K7Z3_9FIRM|nr:uroporphyrinogen decarboxylase family protein [Parasporobacterium paucivorans]SHJ55062.1 Uroporphyrinogen decarboxylase (URO-D) [Parasporobacterium paucivorans DSM 15970]